MKAIYLSSLLLVFYVQLSAQTSHKTAAQLPPALSAIRQGELHDDLFTMASDAMRGRRAGTLDELKAATWEALQAQKAGLKPAGDNGTYFQFFPLQRTTVSKESVMTINNNPLRLWHDAWVTEPVEANINGSVVWLSSLDDANTKIINGAIVAMRIVTPSPVPPKWVSLWGFRYVFYAIRQQSKALIAKGAKAIVLVADSTTSGALVSEGHVLDFEEGTYDLPGEAKKKATQTYPSCCYLLIMRVRCNKVLQQLRLTCTCKAIFTLQ
ncbi:MAG: hypothetical protein M3R72_08820 [Bacteroidota bacterium]|nr:hypothetical protein [Bacteroidota bacterium]